MQKSEIPGNGRFRIAVICGKLGDVDGVSLEVDKWIRVLTELGHEVYTIAGRYASELDSIPPDRQLVCEGIRFGTPEQEYYERLVFPHLIRRPPHLSEEKVHEIIQNLEAEGSEVAAILFEQIQEYSIDVIIAENTNAMPMALIGGVAVYQLAVERRVATIFHHHDFWWERSRFSNNRIERLLGRIMTPAAPGLEHVVLSTYAAHILRSLKRVHPRVIPNCEDFDAPVGLDDYNGTFREALGFAPDDILVVQPTRIVRRKRIEDAVEFTSRLAARHPDIAGRLHFVISLYQGDEPDTSYLQEIRDHASELGVPLHLVSDRVSSTRGTDGAGRRLYTNRDVLANADLLTYLPVWEGFGNALLEGIAARVPVVTTTYLVYKTDIKVMGFENVEILDRYDENGRLLIPDHAVDQAYRLLTDLGERRRTVETNFEIGSKYFGMQTLRDSLQELLDEYGDEIRASRVRVKKSKQAYSV